MQRLTVSIPKPLYDEVERIASRDSRSLGWVIRKAIEVRVQEESPLLFTPQKNEVS